MQEEIMVSVSCLAYNHEKYIRDCLEGFVKQKTNFKYEVIIHDDASTDGTAAIIREYEEKYPDIIKPIYQKENQWSKGTRISYSIILPKCKGKYLAFCEGDDYWCDENKLQKQVDILEAHPDYVACIHQSKVLNCITNQERLYSPYNKDGVIDHKVIFSRAGKAYHLSSLMYKRDLVAKLPQFYFDTKTVGDYPLAIFLLTEGPNYYINDIMSVYRSFAEGSFSRMTKDKEFREAHLLDMINLLKNVDDYTQYRYHKILDRNILNHEYQIWKNNITFDLLKNPRIYKLKPNRLIKIVFLALKKGLLG